ncbi:hypothetical protein L1049_019444 [Liquidambar formosana]|uniref:Uncharacterized protein n=1 Tax=Liquidambar formosana TaxID=63359 RepID=A0AAP0SBR2_LIQFO
MGGCAGKPKDSEISPESLPTEAPASPKKVEAEAVAQEKYDGGETHEEEPLVDLSEPKHEGGEPETKTAPAEVVAQPQPVVTANPTVEPAEAVKNTEDNAAKAANDDTPAPTKEVQKVAGNTEAETKEVQKVAGTTEAETNKSDAAPSSEDKSDAPLVTV